MPNNPLHTAAENAENAAPFNSFQIVYREPPAASAKPEALELAEGRHRGALVMLHQAEKALRTCRFHGCDDTAALFELAQAQAALSMASDLLIEALDVAAGRSERAA